MAQHLLSPLSNSEEYCPYIINKYNEGFAGVCPCQDHEQLFGRFDDTSFGCKTLWHGSSDLLFEIPLQCVSQTSSLSNCSDSEGSVTDEYSSVEIEVDGGDSFSQKDTYQMRAQSIGFSFYAHKIERETNKERAKYLLIPHIGFYKEKICYQFYDSVNDILLEMDPIELCQPEGKISSYVILLTWLALNYKILGGETPACLLGYKSGFHEMFAAQLDKYKEEIEHPCHSKLSLENETRFPLDESKIPYCYEEEKKHMNFISVDE